jgi:DNA-binding Lrp family transcriptional regulator
MTILLDATDRTLVDSWQRDFPLVERPFAVLGKSVGVDEDEAIERLRRLSQSGALSRIGAVVRPNTAGASTLAALAVPPSELEAAAEAVIAEPGVNHAYEREHTFNFWFVVTAADQAGVEAAIDRIERRVGLPVLVLPMVRDFHIDLGFPIFAGRRERAKGPATITQRRAPNDDERALLGTIERGLDLTPRPFAAVAATLGWSESDVLVVLKEVLAAGVVTRFGLVVHHRAFGFRDNAMVVWDLPADSLCATARRFAADDAVTLCYERPRRPNWPYALFTMVHARDRVSARAAVARLSALAPDAPHEILFSTRCFRQRGARLSAA